ncbi:MAG: phage holin family protein [Myxococcota bacterium]
MAKGGGSRQNNSLIKALEGLTDGLYGMFSKRIELARQEIVRDVQRFGILFGILFFCAMILMIAYGLLNLALVLTVGAFVGGVGAMAATAGALSLLHVLVGALVAWRSAGRLEEAKQIFLINRSEFHKDRLWLKEIAAAREAEPQEPAQLPAASHVAEPKPEEQHEA